MEATCEYTWESYYDPQGHEYEAGPLASECTAGHPVAVPTEAERRG